MGHDLFGSFASADRVFREAQEILGYDLQQVCLEGSGRKILPARQEAQVIYSVSCAYAAVLQSLNHSPSATAGHSLGNWAAAWAAGFFDFATGLELVTHVEDLLERSIPPDSQAMGVIIGLDEKTISALIEENSSVWIANWNSPGQYVVGGESAGVDCVLATAAGLNAKRARRLPTDRALHTPLMQEVSVRLREKVESVRWNEPVVPLISSSDFRVLSSSAEARAFFGSFLEQPVRWDRAMGLLCERTAGPFVEVGPGNVLGSMFPFINQSAGVRAASELLEQDVSP
jgi:[acyl-carrier-protein] S-malonyltransferase